MDRSVIVNILNHGFLDGASIAKLNNGSVLILPRWKEFMSRGRTEEGLTIRTFYGVPGGAQTLYDPSKGVGKSIYFLLDIVEGAMVAIHIGLYDTNENRTISDQLLLRAGDLYWEPMYFLFNKCY